MKTGIEFFDHQEFRPGDVVVVGGFAGSGKTFLTTALAGGLVKNTDSEVLHIDLESPYTRWVERVDALKIPDAARKRLRHRGMTDGAFSAQEFGTAAVVLDHMGIMASKDALHEVARIAKLYAVRQKTVVVLGFQLSRELGRPLNLEGWVDPALLPEWVLEFGDQIYLLRNGHGGRLIIEGGPNTPTFQAVIRVKGTRLHHVPDEWASLEFSINRVTVSR